MTMPNFLILGPMKSGTTSLYNYLKQHPQIYMSPTKAPDFFALEGRTWDFGGPEGPGTSRPWTKEKHPERVTDIEEYRALFRGVSNEIAIGEASPIYLYRPEAPNRIRHYIPEAKLITVLRNPVDRAYSAYCYAFQLGLEPLDDFTQALRAEEERIQNDWEWMVHYKHMGFYYTQLMRYYKMFDQKQIRVYLYEDLKADPIGLTQDIFRYLGVDDAFTPDASRRFNVGGVPRRRALHRLILAPNPLKTVAKSLLPDRWTRPMYQRVQRLNLTKAPPLRQEVRRELIEEYQQDILKLQDLIQRDLSGWLQADDFSAHKSERAVV